MVAGRAPPAAGDLLASLHPRYRTPWFTIVFFSILAGLLILPGETTLLGNLYSFGAMLSFTIAHVAVVALRIKEPDRERPYRMPWNVRIRGRPIPMTAVLGGIGTFAAWCAVVVLHGEARTIGIPWMVLGMVGYFLYRRRQGLDPRSPTRSSAPNARPTSTSSSTAPRSCRSSATTSAARRWRAPPS